MKMAWAVRNVGLIRPPLMCTRDDTPTGGRFFLLLFQRWAENPDNGIPAPRSGSMSERQRLIFQRSNFCGRSQTKTFSEMKCGIVYHTRCTCLKERYLNGLQIKQLFFHHRLCRLCYDGDASCAGTAKGKEGTGWTLSRWWIKRLPSCASGAA